MAKPSSSWTWVAANSEDPTLAAKWETLLPFWTGSGTPVELVDGSTVTVTGTPAWATPAEGDVYSLSAGDYVEVTDPLDSMVGTVSQMSFVMRFRPTTGPTGTKHVLGMDFPTDPTLGIRYDYDNEHFNAINTNFAQQADNGAAIDTWHTVVVTLDVPDLTLYVNSATSVASHSTATAKARDVLSLSTSFASLQSAGDYALVAIYEGVLSGAEITAIMADPYETITEAGGGDTTAPTLTSPSGTATGISTADGSVSTDEANGTLDAVVTTSATTPTDVQIAAGQDHTGAAAVATDLNNTVTTTGVQNVSFTGLTANTTYYVHFVHEDAATNVSTAVSSASFTTNANETISGTVTDAGAAVSGALVYLIDQGTDTVSDTTTTDGSGNYSFTVTSAGTYHAVVEDAAGTAPSVPDLVVS